MKIVNKKIGDIFPFADNPRIISDHAVQIVADSLQRFGWQQPIVVDKNFVIIAGHTRHLAAQFLGLDVVPVHVAEELTKKQVAQLRLADNRVGEYSSWDPDALRAALDKLDDELKGYFPTFTGGRKMRKEKEKDISFLRYRWRPAKTRMAAWTKKMHADYPDKKQAEAEIYRRMGFEKYEADEANDEN